MAAFDYSGIENAHEREAIMRVDRMQQARDKERTPTMKVFSQANYHVRVEQDSHGFLGVSLRPKGQSQIEAFAVVPKHRHGTGSTYLFRDAERLSELCIEPEQLIPATTDLTRQPIPTWLEAREALGVTIPEGWAPAPKAQRARLRR
jgi:hypothetical protein